VTRPLDAAVAARYGHALIRELEAFFSDAARPCAVDTIYFGGGTPSIVPPDQIAAVLATCRELLPVAPDCEITLEANPGTTLTPESAREYRLMGINRLSMGAQSYDDRELSSIGRVHSAEDVRQTVRLVRSLGIGNINLDIMAGLPGQTTESWRRSLECMVEVGPEHVSMYMLDLDSHSALYHSVEKGIVLPDEDLVADFYVVAIERLEGAGYAQYEISNFARPGFESRHNLKYWTCQPVLGFGVSSHSYDGTARFANENNLATYIERIEKEGAAIQWREAETAERRLEETLFLGLRLRRGIDWNTLREQFGAEQLTGHERKLAEMSAHGLVEWRDSVVSLTRRGMLLSNEVFLQFV
jgi:oxygen-independent coproporphyrinogen-3 oxidase